MNSSITDTTDPVSMSMILGGSFGVSSGTILVVFFLYRALSGLSGRRLVSDCCGRMGEVGFAIRAMPSTPPTETKSLPLGSASGGGPAETPVGESQVSLTLPTGPRIS